MVTDSEHIHIDTFNNFEGQTLFGLLHKILHYLRHVTGADAGTIYLVEENYLKFTIFQNDSFSYEKIQKVMAPLQDIKLEITKNSSTLAVESYIMDELITIDDVYVNDDFDFAASKDFDKKFDYKTKSILTAPLKNFFDTQKIGVVQLINKKENNELIPFTMNDKEIISLTSHLITLSISTAQNNIAELQRVNESVDRKVALRTQNMEKIQKQLINDANTDPLTGLNNRRHFNNLIRDMFELSLANQYNGSLLILDIDNFKNVNDTYGHPVGDEVLVNLANLLKTSVRKSDICVRFGGEEFVILLPYTKIENAQALANKIITTVNEQRIKLDNNTNLTYTVSIGLSCVNLVDKEATDILHRADKALYLAKRNGKNRVEIN